MASLTHGDYKIAWICALPLEMAAAKVMLDEIHEPLPKPASDQNAYILGKLNGHNIVIACLPTGIYGTISAAIVISHLVSTFSETQFGLMVGIGGGVPNDTNDIRLGDVVVSKPAGRYSGVIQYDYGKAVQDGQFEQTGTLNYPPQALLAHIAHLEADQMTRKDNDIWTIVQDVLAQNPGMKDKFTPPNQHTDYLFCSSCHHVDQESDCARCDKEQLLPRKPRDSRSPQIHYGLIASGDQVMKDSQTRDRLAQQLGVICFEMEAAGLMNQLPTLVIRGICDYSDSHKQKEWQGYAALTAAAYTKTLLSAVPVYRTERTLSKNRNRVRHWMVPLGRNPRFVGRQSEIVRLEELIRMQDGPRKVAITGLGGVGKTQVALELAYRIRDRDKECSIFWLPCTSHEIIEQTYMNLAKILGFHGVTPEEAKQQVKTYLSSERAGKWLLIFDNADDLEMWLPDNDSAGGPSLEDCLPQSEQGHILFTSRNRELAVDLTSSNLIPIYEDRETGLKILERSLVQKNLLEDNVTTAALLEQLTFLPLAITQASAYINKKGLSLSAYYALLQEQEPEVVDLLSKDFKDEGRYKDIQNPVITTWLISFNQIKQQDQLAIDYLSFMACIDPRNIPQTLLLSPTPGSRGIDAVGLLHAYSFITWQDEDRSISMHRLVHIATRNWLRKNSLFTHWIQKVADQIHLVFPDSNYTNRGLWREYLPHALILVHEIEFLDYQEQYIQLIRKIAHCLYSDGRYREAEVLYGDVLKVNHRKHGPEHPSTLNSTEHLASTYKKQGRWKEAEELQVQVIKMSKIVLGPEHPHTLDSIANLASNYKKQGRWKEAEELQVQVIRKSKTVLGPEDPDTLNRMASLASTYRNQGRWNEAEKLDGQVLAISKTVLGSEHPDTLSSMSNLASTYRKQGRWEEAEKLDVQVVKISKIVLGSEHPDTLSSMNNLASTYRAQGRGEEAEKLDVQVVEVSKRILGPEHPDTLISMSNLALTYNMQGRRKETEKLEVQVLEIEKTVLGPEHPNTLTSMSNLALTYKNQGRLEEAEKLQVRVMRTRKIVLGPEHPDTLTSMNNLAYTWNAQGKLQDALSLMQKCAELRNKVLGPDHRLSRSSSRAVIDWEDDINNASSSEDDQAASD